MRSLTVDILRIGPVVTALVGLSSARRKAQQREFGHVPPRVKIELLIDTGASTTLIDSGIMRSLALEPTAAASYTSSTTGGVPKRCDLYDIELVLGGIATRETWRFDPFQVMADSFINEPFQGLLGRDVLDTCRLDYNGRSQKCTLSYV